MRVSGPLKPLEGKTCPEKGSTIASLEALHTADPRRWDRKCYQVVFRNSSQRRCSTPCTRSGKLPPFGVGNPPHCANGAGRLLPEQTPPDHAYLGDELRHWPCVLHSHQWPPCVVSCEHSPSTRRGGRLNENARVLKRKPERPEQRYFLLSPSGCKCLR